MFYFTLVGVAVVASVVGFVFGVKKRGALLQGVASNSDDRKNSDNLNSVCKTEGPYFATASDDELRDMRGEAKEALAERTQMRKEKILNMMRDEAETQKKLEECSGEEVVAGITRVDVEELLDVSEGTARKYLNILEEEGKIAQIGESGRGVRYVVS